ncbi:hypothetical protein C8T65DRAFT_251160 [Cerioporus squamosus]|nr:hypothetical protein C8T65DRAFT_251160 [Cerioporus squamosus]
MKNILASPLFFVVLGEGVIVLLLLGVVLFQCCVAHRRRKTQRRIYSLGPPEEDSYSKVAVGDPFSRYTTQARPMPLQDQEVRRSTASTTDSSGTLRPLIVKQHHAAHKLTEAAGNNILHRARSCNTSELETTSELIGPHHRHIALPSAVHLRPRAPTPLSASTVLAYMEEDEPERRTSNTGEEVREDRYSAEMTSDDCDSGTVAITSQTPASSCMTLRPILVPQTDTFAVSPPYHHMHLPQQGGDVPPYPFLLRASPWISDSQSAEFGRAAGQRVPRRLRRAEGPTEEQRRTRGSSRESRGSLRQGVIMTHGSDVVGAAHEPASYFED